MRILLLGDFSGAGGGAASSQNHQASIIRLDVDNFEECLARLSPRIEITIGYPGQRKITLQFNELDDFHPDTLYRKVDLFRSLHELRDQLSDRHTFGLAASQLSSTEQTPSVIEDDDETLERLLGKPADKSSTGEARAHSVVDDFIKQLVAPHIQPDIAQQQAALIASVDETIAAEMRSILHHPTFQALESSWRSLWKITTELETDEGLELYIHDISKQLLAQEVFESDLSQTHLFRLLEDGDWSVIAGDYVFDSDEVDTQLLLRLGAMTGELGCPFLAAAAVDMLGCESWGEVSGVSGFQPMANQERNWRELRESSVAPWIGLVAPGILLRLPYGSKTDEIDSFDFEEIPNSASDPRLLLWGSPAYAATQLLARAFLQSGWTMQPGEMLDLEDLPAYVYEEDGEKCLHSCAESAFSERTAEAILDLGVMPLIAHRQSNRIRLLRFQSIAAPPETLQGPWD
jgi:type VI secretion system protein ImpC